MNIQSVRGFEKGCFSKALLPTAGLCLALFASASQAASVPKCTVELTFSPGDATEVTDGDTVFLTNEVRVYTAGSCGVDAGEYVEAGNASIEAVTLNGDPRPCSYLGNRYCTAGDPAMLDHICTNGGQCGESSLGFGDGECTHAVLETLASETSFEGLLATSFDTTGLAGETVGLYASYSATGQYTGSPEICNDLLVKEAEDVACGEGDGALITIEKATGPNPVVPGTTEYWTFDVKVHACEDLDWVTAQGGTNGWAQLVDRSNASLHTDDGTAEIRNANKKTDVILWTIGEMNSGDDATLTVDLSGSIKARSEDCKELFLSGPWSAMFSTDGLVFEKSEYTGRVTLFTDTDGDPYDCSL